MRQSVLWVVVACGLILNGCIRGGGKGNPQDDVSTGDSLGQDATVDVFGSDQSELSSEDMLPDVAPWDGKSDLLDSSMPDATELVLPDLNPADVLVDTDAPSLPDLADADDTAEADVQSDAEDVQPDLPETQCVPDCQGKECGDDGCGGFCGHCPMAAPVCNAQQLCELGCAPQCQGLECGPDGCGGVCGECQEGIACASGFCQDGVCLGQDCSGHGVCAKVGSGQCLCDPGYHQGDSLECHAGDFCMSGLITIDQVIYPAGSSSATGGLDSLKGNPFSFELCFFIVTAGETSCYTGADFVPCMLFTTTVASADFGTDNQALQHYAQNVLGEANSIAIHYENNATTFVGFNLTEGPVTQGALGVEFLSTVFSSGQAWNSPLRGLSRWTGSRCESETIWQALVC